MTQEEEIAHLRAENQELREALKQALARIEEREKQKTPPPEFVKANAKKPKAEEQKPRKKRDAKHTHGRGQGVPTQMVEHHIVSCPDCHLRPGGISLARVREVIDIPPPLQWKCFTSGFSRAGAHHARHGTKLQWIGMNPSWDKAGWTCDWSA